MTTIKIYGVGCEGDGLADRLDVPPPSSFAVCAVIGPENWRRVGYTSQEARRRAKREGWKRVKYEARYGTVMCDVCPACHELLEPALKAAQS